ncbi:claudin-10 [Silurus asotus]|uniref:Claudin-10 n=1 Tax=Silurus asotus TaxID=30991 RepID=A0AAD5AFB8_SILAS|nr:claudin-10 [Silurus asotus]
MNIILIQVFGFLISTVGWFLVCCTMVMDYWRVSYIGGQGGSWVINAAWYWSTLWRECYTDSSDVANCRDYDTMWVVRPETRTDQRPLQAVRALLLVGMFVGFFAAIFCFIGMDCTYIGGHERKKCRLLLIGSALHFTGGVSCFAAYCLYTARLGTVLFTQMADARILRFYIGLPVFFGLIGSTSIILGSVLYFVTLYRICQTER